jgi:hypothetical protein
MTSKCVDCKRSRLSETNALFLQNDYALLPATIAKKKLGNRDKKGLLISCCKVIQILRICFFSVLHQKVDIDHDDGHISNYNWH